MANTETWKDIKGFEGLYQVSNMGNVKSLSHKVQFGRSYRITKETILLPHKQSTGYLRVTLKKNNQPKYMLVHRLVAMAFIPNPDHLEQVNHKDENKTNNCVSNLEWCNSEYNNNFGTHTERTAKAQSKAVAAYKDGVEIMRFKSSKEAERNGYNHACVWLCCNGKYKQYKGYIWKYAS